MSGQDDLFNYACVLARYRAVQFALMVPNNTYTAKLTEELVHLNKWLKGHSLMDFELIRHVRKLVPESDWDKDLDTIMVKIAAKKNAGIPLTDEDNANIQMLLKEDWEDRLKAKKSYELTS